MKKLFTFFLLTILLIPLTKINGQTNSPEKGQYGLIFLSEEIDDGVYPSSFAAIIDLDGEGRGIISFLGISGKQVETDTFVYVMSDSNYFEIYDSTGAEEAIVYGIMDRDFQSFSLVELDTNSFGIGYAVRIDTASNNNISLSGTYTGNQIYFNGNYHETKRKAANGFYWGGSRFNAEAINDSTLKVIEIDNFGEKDTTYLRYYAVSGGLIGIVDTTVGVTIQIGFVSQDGNTAVMMPTYMPGISFSVKNSDNMDISSIPIDYRLFSFNAGEEGEIVIETVINLDGAGTGTYRDIRNSSGEATDGHGIFAYTVDSKGALVINTEEGDALYGAISPNHDFITFTYLDSSYLSIFVGIVKESTPTAIGEKDITVENFSLEQNYPNPFNPSTEISYRLPNSQKVELSVFNILGQKIKILDEGIKTAGIHKITWDGKDSNGRAVGSGIYFYRLKTPAGTLTKKMTLIR